GEASILMNIQEMATLVQYRLPVKIFIMNNKWMGMVRQWQELLHGGRYSESYSDALPDFVKLAEAYGIEYMSICRNEETDAVVDAVLKAEHPVLVECAVPHDEPTLCFGGEGRERR
ncbi:MAG TPA: thiamine pyrophosphate-dependent enzyme, partial [Oscillospiraceae bacterium]|nr:thiamine pyrophosphate-dependent enzyme [Oscillospiraceae bacterium]